MRKQVALHQMAPQSGELHAHLIGLDPFSDDGHLKFTSQQEYCFDESFIPLLQGLGKAVVQFDGIDRQREQSLQRGVTGAKVIQMDFESRLSQRQQLRFQLPVTLGKQTLRELKWIALLGS